MYLSHYFESDILEAIKSDTLFNDSIEADLPRLPVASLAYEKQLQLQEDRSFDMETAINRSKHDRKLYHSLSHYLYSKMLLSKTTHFLTTHYINTSRTLKRVDNANATAFYYYMNLNSGGNRPTERGPILGE